MADNFDYPITNYKTVFDTQLLNGKVAFVTGGGSGIGFTITEILLRHGCKVAIASRNLDRVVKSASLLSGATKGSCLPLQVDVRQPQSILQAVEETIHKLGKIDILVNNAAGNFIAAITSLSHNAFKTVVEIDLLGTFNTSKIVYEKCLQGRGGVVVNISAMLYQRGILMQSHAGSAKAGVDALTRHMAVEWGRDNVRVVGVAPGPIAETVGIQKLGGVSQTAEEFGRVPTIALERLGTKVDIANAVLFLVSPAASYITGHVLVVDGGSWMTSSNYWDVLSPLKKEEAKKIKMPGKL